MEHNNQFIVKGRPLSSVDVAKANDAFEHFIGAATLKSILGHYRNICDLLHLRPNIISLFYPKLKVSLSSWKAKALWKKFDARASHKCYARGKACSTTRVLIIGAGPCGLRTAIEAQLLGAKVVVVEKRDRMSRNNVLHLWPFVIEDLRALGAKKFLGKFCAGSIDHISIRQLQCILLKVCLLLGVEIYTEVSFEKLIEPNLDEKIGWRAEFKPYDHPVSQYEFDVIIGADGKRNTLQGFKRKEFRGKLAIAITANFINKHTEADARVEEISGVAFIFNQKFFKELNMETGIDLENIVYYKDETHYFVMTAKKHSLLEKGVIKQDFSDTARLLSHENVDREALLNYAREAADFSTNYQMPDLEFAVNHYGQPDVAMFDFTSMYAAENASKVIERCGYKLLMVLVGDSLLEPFWPTGSGCARGFLSSLDACWAIKGWGSGLLTPLEILAERESIYRLLAQTTPENLNKDYKSYTLDPSTRYPNLNKSTLSPPQVLNLYNTDDPSGVELTKVSNSFSTTLESQKKRRKKDTYIDAITLINWIKEQVKDYKDIVVEDITSSLKDGRVLCAIINHYRPDLLDYNLIQAENVIQNNQLAFDLLEKELGVLPVMTGEDINNSEVPDYLTMFSYLTKVYETFRGEIPHIKHLNLDLSEPKEQIEEPLFVKTWASRSSSAIVNNPTKYHSENNSLNKSLLTSERKAKKRKSFEKNEISMDHENYLLTQSKENAAVDKEFAARIRNLEDKWRGPHSPEKRPKGLMRAIGKIDSTDWNIKEIEKKIKENKLGKSRNKEKERVPKWNREQFLARQTKMEKKHLNRQNSSEAKFCELDRNLKHLEQRLKEGSVRDLGKNKVAAITEKFVTKLENTEQPIQKSASKSTFKSNANNSEYCHFCQKRVYLMERLSAEGRFFHSSCFKCQYCYTNLRLGNYLFDREGQFGYRFYCSQHFGMVDLSKDLSNDKIKYQVPTPLSKVDLLERVETPERIELENLSSEYDESLSQIDEDEWTDRNFGASTTEICSSNEEDYSSSFSDSETDDEDAFEEALEEPPTKEGTLRLMERYKLRYSKDSQKGKIDYDDSSSDSDHSSYHENTSEDDEDDPVTEGEEEIRARELRKQEVAVEPPVVQTDTGSDTEVISEETSSNSSNKHNSATEISTDSEFAVDDPTPTREVPAIIFNDFHVTKTRGSCGKLKILQVKSHVLQVPITSKSHNQNVNLNPVTTAPLKVLPILSKVTQNNPIDGYCLNRTQSTSGIATRVSLELKKKYLLGDNGLGGAIQKSGSVSAIDSKFKSFHSNITDCQKLLKTKIETLEPNLDKTNFKNSDFKSPLSTIPKPELISNQRLETREINNPTTNILKENVTLLSEQHKFEDDESVPESNTVVECFNYDLEGRPRSPLQEIPILVPTINWTQVNKNRDNCISSDSLISDSDQSAGNNKSYQRTKKIINTIPRVEICDDNGEVLHDWDNNFAFDSLNIPPPTLSHLTGHSSALNDTSKSVTCSKIILNQPKILPHLHKEYTHVEHSNKDKVGRNPTSEQSTPSDQESVADHTTTVLTETELSDWARDGSVSDDFEDIEFGLNLGLKNELKSVSLQKEASKAKMEDFEEAKHVCGKEKYQKNVENFQNILSNLEFMDTEEESSDEEELKDNFIKNSGYVVFHNEDEIAKDSLDPGIDNITQTVNPLVLATIDFDDLSSQDNNTGYCIIGDDDQISNLKKVIQPICDNEENSLLVVDTGTTTEENTCSDLTVKNVNSEQELIKNSKADMYLQLGTSNETEQKKDQINQDYLNFCQRLQSKIEFGNVKDSISIKKLKCKDKYAQVDTVKNEEKNIVESNILTENNQPIQNISYKKEIIQKSRSENQKLIQEMVMNKMKAQNKVLERKRRNRNLNSLDKSSDLIKPNILDIENQENITKQVSNQMSPLKSCPIEIKNIQKSLGEVQPLSKHFSKNVGVERNSWPNIQTVVKIDPEAPNFQIKSHNKELYKTNDKLKTKIPTNVNDELVVNINDHLPQKEKLIRRIKKDNCSEEIKDNLKLFFTNSDRQNRCVHMNEQAKKKRPHSYTSKSEEIHPGRTKSVSDISKNSIHKSSNLNIKEEIKNISHLCKSDSNLMVNNSDNFKKPNVERRKSISKLISEFFGRKKDNKIVTSNESPSKKFITKMTSKSKDNTKEQILRTRSLSSIASTTQKYISTSPPPIPPLPLNYAKTRTSNFIGASSDEESEWKPCQLHSDDLDRPDVSTEGRRSIKNSRRLSRQAQLKRHRTAQEIQRQLEETEVKIKELEQKGVLVEKALRGEANDELNGREESELFQQWFNIMRELTDLRRFEKELTVRAQELQLEDRHARLQQDLRERLENDGVKSKKDVMLESTIIGEMMEIVKKRDSLIAVLEQDRIRYSKEDQDFEEEMLQRRLLPSQFSKNNNY